MGSMKLRTILLAVVYIPKFILKLIHWPTHSVVIIIFAHVVLQSVRPSPLFKNSQNKTIFK